MYFFDLIYAFYFLPETLPSRLTRTRRSCKLSVDHSPNQLTGRMVMKTTQDAQWRKAWNINFVFDLGCGEGL